MEFLFTTPMHLLSSSSRNYWEISVLNFSCLEICKSISYIRYIYEIRNFYIILLILKQYNSIHSNFTKIYYFNIINHFKKEILIIQKALKYFYAFNQWNSLTDQIYVAI